MCVCVCVCVCSCVKLSTKGLASIIDEAVWSPLWAKRKIEKSTYFGIFCAWQLPLFPLSSSSFYVSSLSCASCHCHFSLMPLPIMLSSSVCLNSLTQLTDVCLFPMSFSIKVQTAFPAAARFLPVPLPFINSPRTHLSICVTFRLSLNSLTLIPFPHFHLCYPLPLYCFLSLISSPHLPLPFVFPPCCMFLFSSCQVVKMFLLLQSDF